MSGTTAGFEAFTRARVAAMAPDAASLKAGTGLARADKWVLLCHTDDGSAAWGEIAGSGSKPYQVRLDLSGPAFGCSCPSRKIPCKHVLGLLLILAESPDALQPAQPADWVADWLAKRRAKAEATPTSPTKPKADPAAAAKRAAKREDNIRAGIDDLSVFLVDLMRTGLAGVATQPASFWDRAAARLVDAQAPGLAGMVRKLGDLAGVGHDWQTPFLTLVGRLHLACEAYRKLDQLPDATAADLRQTVGWSVPTADVIASEPVVGTWCVAGSVEEVEDRLTVRRTWLLRESDGRPALVLDFDVPGRPKIADQGEPLLPGTRFDGELCYYPGLPLRVVVKTRTNARPVETLPTVTLPEMLDCYAEALAVNPWLPRWPVSLANVVPVRQGDRAFARDVETGQAIPLAEMSPLWPLLAISGGGAVSLFGEWDGRQLLVLGASADGRHYASGSSTSGRMLNRVA